MEKIKYLDIEYDILNNFIFKSRVFELTKGNNIELLISLYNCISVDLSEKLCELLKNNNIKHRINDFDADKFKEIGSELLDRAILTGVTSLDYVANESYSEQTFNKYLSYKKYCISFDYYFYHFDLSNKLISDSYTIIFLRDKVNDEINEKLDYYNSLLSELQSIIESEYDKIKIEDKIEINEPEAIDLSDTTATEKIIYLHKLGVIDFLRTKQPFISVPDKVSQVISAFTGIKIDSVRPMIRPILNNDFEDRKNPLNSKNPVNKVTKQLNEIGFNLDETI